MLKLILLIAGALVLSSTSFAQIQGGALNPSGVRKSSQNTSHLAYQCVALVTYSSDSLVEQTFGSDYFMMVPGKTVTLSSAKLFIGDSPVVDADYAFEHPVLIDAKISVSLSASNIQMGDTEKLLNVKLSSNLTLPEVSNSNRYVGLAESVVDNDGSAATLIINREANLNNNLVHVKYQVMCSKQP